MKKIWILLLAFSLLALVACTNLAEVEDEDMSKANNELEMDIIIEEDLEQSYFVDEDAVLEIGLLAPSFSLENLNLDGDNINLDDYRGKYVLLNFWATWCGYCKDEMPDLEAFASENSDLKVIGVNVEESRDIVEKYIEEGGYTFDVALDSEGMLSKAYYVSSFPTSIFIDRYGNLIGGVQGLMKKDDMEKVLDYVKEEEAKLKSQ